MEGTVVLSSPSLSRAVFARGYNEATESQAQSGGTHSPDPETTEEITGDATAEESFCSGSGKNAATHIGSDYPLDDDDSGSNSRAERQWAIPEVTSPIAASRPPASRAALPARVRSGDTDENSAELIDLDVEPAIRKSVRPGEVLSGRYVVLEKVEHRGMGLVYKALDKRRKEAGLHAPWVALKFAAPANAGSSATSTYLRQEFANLSQLSHPNIVNVFDFDNDGGLDFIVMEWLEGETLSSLLGHVTSKCIALGKAEEIIRCIGSALAHAHGLGVVHGDVKPSNVFLMDNRTVKLFDFGSSGQTTEEGATGTNWATRAYASCEVLRGSIPQPRDDVFALGVTAYGLLSGERPFGELDAAEASEQGVSPEPLPPRARERWPAVQHALELDALDRPSDAALFLQEFDDLPGEASEPPLHSQLEHIAYGAVAVALLLALVAWAVGSVGGLPAGENALRNAERALAAGRLVEPADESAFAYYSEALETATDNSEAVQGLNRIAEEFLTRARTALDADAPDEAAENLAIARRVMPGHYGIAVTADLLASYGRDLLTTARETARSDLAEAERLLERAAPLLSPQDPAVAAARNELAQRRIDAQVESLLRGVDERILAERLTLPQGDSAVDLLQQARTLAPDDRQVALAADRIATALLFQAMFAISGGKLNEAETYIEAADSLNVRHLALARARYELVRARNDARQARVGTDN